MILLSGKGRFVAKISDLGTDKMIRASTADVGVKLEKNSWNYQGKIYVSAPLSDSWEAFTPPHARITLGKLLHWLVVAFFSVSHIYRHHCLWEGFTLVSVLT